MLSGLAACLLIHLKSDFPAHIAALSSCVCFDGLAQCEFFKRDNLFHPKPRLREALPGRWQQLADWPVV